jgi:hypothetical protein
VGGPAGRFAAAPNKSRVPALRPRPSLSDLAATEPGSRDRPEDRSPVRSVVRLAALHSRRFRIVSCFLTLNHPLQPFTTVISGFPLGFLADSFREGVA